MSDHMVWVDCEMTGLDLERDALIEIAVLVTDAGFEVLTVSAGSRPQPVLSA